MTVTTIDTRLPVIAITMGDAAGIGPEVIAKALADSSLRPNVRPVVIGDARILEKTCEAIVLNCKIVPFSPRTPPDENTIEIVDLKNIHSGLKIGNVSAQAGKAAGEYIEKAVGLWNEGLIDAVCTAPINKESLALGGYDHAGHTEFFAELTGTRQFAMSFFAGQLRVVLLSTHLPLATALSKVKKAAIADLIIFTNKNLAKLLNKKVRIAVAGLNPHASENGKFGTEEAEEIAPAIAQCSLEGIDASGPYSADTIFLRAYKGEFDAVIAHYHDQATIPVKALSFGSAVNVTLGLPFIRTSVDHGTAFDIAGKGIADGSSMRSAIVLAGELTGSANRQKEVLR